MLKFAVATSTGGYPALDLKLQEHLKPFCILAGSDSFGLQDIKKIISI